MNKNLNITIVSDGTDTITQSRELALRLTLPQNITKIYKDAALNNELQAQDHSSTDLAIGVGFNVTDSLLNIKQQNGRKTKIAIILDPLTNHEKFDFIILPSYEPYKITGPNIIRSTGLINFVNTKYLNLQKMELDTHDKYKFLRRKNLKPPFLTVVIGGRHTGGNIDEQDAKILADKINEIVLKTNGTALITTSKRTELKVSEVLHENLNVPYFLYDYKLRESENPYGAFLTIADQIIVTGESTRMMSEVCSTGKTVRIYRPREYGFQYKPLVDELINGGHALEFNHPITSDYPQLKKLDEAGRIAEIIKNNM